MWRRVAARPGATSYPLLLVVAVAALVVLTACSSGSDGPVEVAAPDLTGSDRTACEQLLDRLPSRLADQPGREVTPAGAPAAAWGDPPIVLTCGVELPREFGPAAACTNADGVDWFTPPEQFQDEELDVVMTAVGVEPVVEVTLPAEYRPEGAAAVMSGLAGAVKTLPVVRSCG